ncbi:hypothetical protein CBW24_17945 (plasmid) [Pacificitalea manganoxidans]|uniref:Polysaccharide deacetylase n=1 Tax=Pacificitalea manganoxidans TaxID=1411902 RepID=A0A291M5M3_9RHOB|nr:hypothetical protein CBW24_17945 [Pacificitalea manganoxidans]
MPVFHVEKLYNDAYHKALRSFLKGYRDMTGKRAVITCMTPLSPILAAQMQEASFSTKRYWDRIAEAAENGIVGLHGHFLRTTVDQGLRPMHHAFHDLDVIRGQIGQELDALRLHGHMDEDRMIYSGGWWFMTPGLRGVLSEFGFHWDYSLSSSRYNISPGSIAVERQEQSGNASGGHQIRSDTAVSGLARPGRPFQAIGKLLAEPSAEIASTKRVSLYSHDYDLNLAPALHMIERFCKAGFGFHEPEPKSQWDAT